MFILLQLLSLLTHFICLTAGFSPDTSDYDAYGLKVAANNLMIVEALNEFTQFNIQFGPYTDNTTQNDDRWCSFQYDDSFSLDSIDYDDSSSWYIYAVALGKQQSNYNVFFVGEMLNINDDGPAANRTFVGVLTYTGSNTTIDCDNFIYAGAYVEDAYPHQEHLVMVTDPLGLVAYGFSNLFTFSYTASTNNLTVHPNNSLSNSTAFLPFAVDYDGNRGIIAGFIDNGQNSRM
jgi:hypothetical protein